MLARIVTDGVPDSSVVSHIAKRNEKNNIITARRVEEERLIKIERDRKPTTRYAPNDP